MQTDAIDLAKQLAGSLQQQLKTHVTMLEDCSKKQLTERTERDNRHLTVRVDKLKLPLFVKTDFLRNLS